MKTRIDTTYDAELRELSANVAHMGALAVSMLRDSVRALLMHDPELARAVIRDDDRMDTLEVDTDALALDVIARRAPMGSDLRFLMAVMKTVTDLERVGDLATNVAERALALLAGPGISPPPELHALATASVAQMEMAMLAWRSRDPALARRLQIEDRGIDALNRAAFSRLVETTRAHPGQFERALALSSVCRYLERAGDHAVNVGERLVYWIEGTEIRHGRA